MSKAFNFSLQKVLDVREMVEDKKAMGLQKAQAETDQEKRILASIEAEKERVAHPEETQDSSEGVSLQSLTTRSAYLDQLNDKIEDQSSQVSISEETAEEKRQEYIYATKEKMVLEKLKENHREVYKKKNNQIEIKEESEIASRISRNEDRS